MSHYETWNKIWMCTNEKSCLPKFKLVAHQPHKFLSHDTGLKPYKKQMRILKKELYLFKVEREDMTTKFLLMGSDRLLARNPKL